MNLLPLDDLRWRSYRSGYNRVATDATDWIRKLLSKDFPESHWSFLWDDLHHQGDVGEASYAVIPYLAEYLRQTSDLNWNIFSFAACVELERTENGNPPIPTEIQESYYAGLKDLSRLAVGINIETWSTEQTMGVAACLAVSRGQRLLARAYLELSDEIGMDV
jgi:hypothetical protein